MLSTKILIFVSLPIRSSSFRIFLRIEFVQLNVTSECQAKTGFVSWVQTGERTGDSSVRSICQRESRFLNRPNKLFKNSYFFNFRQKRGLQRGLQRSRLNLPLSQMFTCLFFETTRDFETVQENAGDCSGAREIPVRDTSIHLPVILKAVGL